MKKLLHKIDQKLIRNYPLIWETKIHIFLPLLFVIYIFLYILGYISTIDNNGMLTLDYYSYTPILVIPTIVFLIFWIVAAVKYNVFKNGGKITLLKDYFQIAIYFIILFFTMQIPIVSVFGFHHKFIKNINKKTILKEIENINKGYSVLTCNQFKFKKTQDNFYSIGYSYLLSNHLVTEYNDDFSEDDLNEYISNRNTPYIMNRSEMIDAINQFKRSVEKSSGIKFEIDAKQFIDYNIKTDFTKNNYLDYLNEYSSDKSEQQFYKIKKYFKRINKYGFRFVPRDFISEFYWELFSYLSLFFSLLFWTFKRNETRNFVFGLISFIVNPLCIGLISVFLSILNVFDENKLILIIMWITFFVYLILLTSKIKKKNHSSWVITAIGMTFHLYLSILIIMTLEEIEKNKTFDFVFWFSPLFLIPFILFLVIPLRKIYKKNWFLPSKR